MIPNIGPLEIGVLLLVVLCVFGPKKLPELGQSLGKGIRGFTGSLRGEDEAGAAERAVGAGERVEAGTGEATKASR